MTRVNILPSNPAGGTVADMSLKISRVLHAGHVLETAGSAIAFDPIFENPFSRNCHAFPQVRFNLPQIRVLKLAAVFISHLHDDHLSLESLNLLDRATPIYLFCQFPELFEMIRSLGFKNVHALHLDEPVMVGAFEVIPRKALDADVDSLFQIKAGGMNILNVVDSWIDPDILHQLVGLGPWDLVMWPFQTLREIEVLSPKRAEPADLKLPPEWIAQLQALNPRFVIPSSCQFIHEPWSWYNHALFPITYQQFQTEMRAALPKTEVVRLNPSVSVELSHSRLGTSAPLTWVVPVGEQEVDFEFKPGLIPPPTSEIAQRFPAITAAQTEKVFTYCREGLLEKHRSIDPPQGYYFQKPRRWALALYDHQGNQSRFYYLLSGEKITLVSAADAQPLAWSTEIPLAKLYAALEHGESLTSLYLRINDLSFDSLTEKELVSVDIMEDPLIRCLFTGAVGAYQQAQLQRIAAGAMPLY